MLGYSQQKILHFFDQSKSKYDNICERAESSVPNLEIFSRMIGPERAFLIENLLKAAVRRSNELLVVEDESMQKIAIVRFLFESLVLTRLIMQDEVFARKTYYASFIQHWDKKNAIIGKISREIALLERYIILEKELRNELNQELEKKPDSIDEVYEENKRKDQQLLDNLLHELTVFTDDAAWIGFASHKQTLEKMLASYESEKIDLMANIVSALQALNGSCNTGLSGDVLVSKLKNITKDDANWKQKADKVGLAEEYEFIYRYSSGLLHSGTFAFFTPHELGPEENVMLTRIGLKYLNAIVESIRSSPIFSIKVLLLSDTEMAGIV